MKRNHLKVAKSLRVLGAVGPMPRGLAGRERKRGVAQEGLTKALVQLRYYAAHYGADFANASRPSYQQSKG